MAERQKPRLLFKVFLPFLVLTVAVGYLIDRGTAGRHLQFLRSSLAEQAAKHGTVIERVLTEYIQVSRGIESVLLANPNISEAEFIAIASNLRRNSTGIIKIAVAPDLVVKYVYPVEDNVSVLGLDYRKQHAQLGAVELARETGRPVVAGPVDLVQGGRGFIIRTPVFLANESHGAKEFWGIVSVVASEAHFLKVLNEEEILKHSFDIDFAIRGANGSGANGPMVTGNPAVFENDPVLFGLGSRFGAWQLGLVPANGWPTHVKNYKLVWFFVVLVGAILMLIELAFEESRNAKKIAQKNLEDAIEAIDDGFAIFDAKDKLVMCNSKYKDIYRKSASKLVPGSTFSEIIKSGLAKGQYPEALGREEEWYRTRMEEHGRAKSDTLQRTDDGRWLKVSERRTPEGNIVAFRVDITELIEARAAAEAANQAKSQFLDSINHEMRTPLTVMLGYNSFLINPKFLPSYKLLKSCVSDDKSGSKQMMKITTALLDEVAGFAQKVRKSGQNLLELVNETLDLTAMDSGELRLERDAVLVKEMAKGLVDKFDAEAVSKNIELRCDLGNQTAYADPKRLIQVLEQLVGNALKFTESGFVKVSSKRLGKFVVFEVKDTGRGIADVDTSRIFQNFSQGDASVTRRFNGTGIGLALCKNLVKLHGGTMSVASELGKGSIFTFSVPVWVEPDSAKILSTHGTSYLA